MPKINLSKTEIRLTESLVIDKFTKLHNEAVDIKGKIENIKAIYRKSSYYKSLKNQLKGIKSQMKTYMKIYKKLHGGLKDV